jgi:hypothetical protein
MNAIHPPSRSSPARADFVCAKRQVLHKPATFDLICDRIETEGNSLLDHKWMCSKSQHAVSAQLTIEM